MNLNANKGQGASFIWSGIWTAKEELKKGFRWVLGNGGDIVATKDQWLRSKGDFRVEQSHRYEGRTELVSSLFNANSKSWNVGLINSMFEGVDVAAILSTSIPQREVKDRVAWTGTSNGIYSAKSGYNFWFERMVGVDHVPQHQGWSKVWRLSLPHKVKIFIRRFCRNNIPVRMRLQSKGITLPVGCPMCGQDSETLLHLFFECVFAAECWRQVNLVYDMVGVVDGSGWLLDKLNEVPTEEVVKLCTVLWGVWFWRNKKVWSDKAVTATFAMEESCKSIASWREARKANTASSVGGREKLINRWIPPEAGAVKINVDASVRDGADTFSVGMVLRGPEGDFIAGKTINMQAPGSVFEAEAIGVREALSWVKDQQLQNKRVFIESDSQLTVRAIQNGNMNYLEAGVVMESCCQLLRQLELVSVNFVRRNANRVAHEIARFPCLAYCQVLFTSPPLCVVEALMYDVS